MKRTVLLLLTFGLTQALYCQKNITQKLDELMTAYSKVNKFNGAVLVSSKGKLTLRKAYGLQDANTKAMNDVNSIFQIYSVTKTFTSTVILKLVEQNKLSLSDKLSKFYPGFPRADSITIENLLTHTSGLYDYTRGGDMGDQSEQEFVKLVGSKPFDFSPGGGWSYCNSGYWFLGFIIQKVSGLKYEDAVREYVFQPLQMTLSGFDFRKLVDKHKTKGYEVFTDNVKKEAVVYASPGPFAAGAIYSTIGDLYKYYQGIKKNAIISHVSQEAAWTPFRNGYGYGWIIDSVDRKRIVSHSGGAAGYRSNFVMIPEEDVSIILLNNQENANLGIITKNIMNILFDKPYKIPVNIKLNSDILSKYTGAFALNPKLTLYVTLEDGRLIAQASGQGKTMLLAEKENHFYVEEVGGFVEFVKDSSGNYNEIILDQGGRQMKAKRIYPTWGLTGTATSKGWNDSLPDIQLTEDKLVKGKWLIQNIQLKSGLLVFKLNNDWGYHYGDNNNDMLLEMYGKDIRIEEDGVYDIMLDLTDTMKPGYTIMKK